MGTRRAGKKSIIGGLLALSMVLTGIGCAYWTDTLNITTKATTDDFSMTFADLDLCAQYGNEMTSSDQSIVDGIDDKTYVNNTFFTGATADYNKIVRDHSIDACKKRQKGYDSVESSIEFERPGVVAENIEPYNAINTKGSCRINITINQMYPGCAQALRTDVLSVGSIATRLSSLKFNVKGFEDSGRAVDMLGIALYMDGEQYHPTIDEGKLVLKLVSSLAGEDDYLTVGDAGFIRLSTLKKFSDEEVHKVITNVTVFYSPIADNRMDLFLVVVMDLDAKDIYTTGSTTAPAKNGDKTSQKRVVEVSIDFLWDQFNIGKDAGNPNYLVKQDKPEKRQVPIGLTVT